jgi:hypothetical protein
MNNGQRKLQVFEWYGYQLMAGFAYFGWGVSSVFSYIGVISVTNLPWWMKAIAAVFSVGVNVVEFMFNRMSIEDVFHPESVDDVILTIFGLTCYAYDYWTNMLGFLILFAQTTNVILVWHTDKTLLIWPSLFALGFAFGPEPLFKRFLRDCPAKPKSYVAPKPSALPYQQPVQRPVTPGQQYPSSVGQRPMPGVVKKGELEAMLDAARKRTQHRDGDAER